MAGSSLQIFSAVYFPHHCTIKNAPYQLAEFKHQQRLNSCMRYIRAEPRDHGKTTRMMILILWAILYEKKKYILIVSDTDEQSMQMFSNVKAELDDNDFIKEDFGDLIENAKVNTGHKVLLNNGVLLQCLGSGRKLRGLKHHQHRPDLIILDDVENDRNVRSQDQRRYLMDWFLKVILPMLSKKSGDLFVIGTVLHPFSLLNKLLNDKQFEKWNRKKYSAINYQGNPIWKDKFSKESLMNIKLELGPKAFESEYQNNPLDDDSAIFDREWLQFYDDRPDDMSVAIAVDPAVSKREKADFFVIIVLGKCNKTGHLYILHISQSKNRIKKHVNMIFSLAREFPPDKVLIETVAYQEVLKEVIEDECRATGHYLPVIGIKNHSDKLLRISKLQPVFQRGDILIRRDMVGFIEQYTMYPSVEHDDMLDALEMAVSSFRGSGVVMREF